jgi:hypothetical protein
MTLKQIMNEGAPILHVTHDSDDHGWQFLGLEDAKQEDAELVCMSHIVELDPTVLQVAHIPPGWRAWRENVNSGWEIEKNPYDENYPYPSLEEEGYEFDVIKHSEREEYGFSLPNFPSDEERSAVKPGDYVKLIFRYKESVEENDKTITCERMWVEVKENRGEYLVGRLDNKPNYTTLLSDDDLVRFNAKHIIEFFKD